MLLSDPVTNLPLVGPSYEARLEKLGIGTIYELLHHVPFRYIDFRKTVNISSLVPDETVTTKGEVIDAKNQYTRQGRKLQLFTLSDGTGEIEIVWFNQPFLINSIRVGDNLAVSGTVSWFGRKKAIISPEYEKADQSVHTGRLLPIYHETAGISSKWLRKRITDSFAKNVEIKEFLDQNTLDKHGLIGFSEAVRAVHFPASEIEAQKGRERLAFNEMLFMHLATLERKRQWTKNEASYKFEVTKKIAKEFEMSLEFNLTDSQKRSIKEIYADLAKPSPMNRLLEGDVGSGKTVVAAAACFASFANGYQSIVMAPTQILAQQHFNTLKKLFEPFQIRVSLITAGTKSETIGKTDVFVGTHALIHQKLDLDTVGLVVIDEQHRFGVEQRNHLVKKTGKKSLVPHVLTMTATPIPRTIALAFYGDLDLSVLDELPRGRQQITTWLVPPKKRDGAYKWIGEQIVNERVQAYIVCPLIEISESETMQQIKAAKAEYENLTEIYPNLRLGLLHGKQKLKEKNAVLDDFKEGKVDILVTTPVVEVGIDVANATIMMIEAAERFGLAQLHQLRGRVGRGSKKSYCLVMTEADNKKSIKRLEALKKTISGFELAEIDLSLRGPGEVFGTKQSGFPELKIASWSETELLVQSKEVAEKIIENTNDYQTLLTRLAENMYTN